MNPLAERLKKKITPPVQTLMADPDDRPAAPVEEIAPKPAKKAKPRKCCASVKGQPHEASCKCMAPKKVKGPWCLKGGRLPNGSKFHVAYDASGECWRGSLTVEGKSFQGVNPGVFGLLKYLDTCYRVAIASGAIKCEDSP